MTIPIQIKTGIKTEESVLREFNERGIQAFKPIPDNGIDLIAHHPENPENHIKIQIKGRGSAQSSKRYRWFQLRNTLSQRKAAVGSGLTVDNAWRKKVDKCDFFILVSERFKEKWVFNKTEIIKIIEMNQKVYGNRADNKEGKQVEIDLDICSEGVPLTEIFQGNCNNFEPIIEALQRPKSKGAPNQKMKADEK